MNRVVVTGIGVLSPLGNDYPSFVEGLKNGRSGAGPITYFDTRNFKTKFACELKNFNAEDRLHRKIVRRLDAFTQYALYSTEEAFEHSGLDLEKINLDRAGVIWGSGIGGLKSLQDEIESNAGKDTLRFSPFMIPKMIPDIAPGHISIQYGFKGMNYCTVSACASSTHALVNATDYIRLGKADVLITGGSEAAITKTGIGGFSSMKALSQRNDDPEKASRPFDKDRDGFVLGEGSATLILESLDHALARGATILAEIKGGGMSADAYHITAPHPEGIGAINVMRTALEDADLAAEDIDYINVHGTSTPLGDVAEIKAIQEVFKDHAYKLNISSTKSMTGHLLGAAGAMETVVGIASIRDGFIPPTINHETADPKIDENINLTLNEVQEKPVRTVLSNTFGFGGHNSSVIIQKFEK